jgi:zinc finger protein
MSDAPLFPSIGTIADQTDLLEDRPDTPLEPSTNGGETEEKVVQEIESLCMKCHEQVRIHPLLRSKA